MTTENTDTPLMADCSSATCSPSDYDAGLLNDFGGGDVGWWQDYLRAEIGRANDYWREIHQGEADDAEMQRICVRGMRVKNTQLANANERMKAGLLELRERIRNSQNQTTSLMKMAIIVEISLENASDVPCADARPLNRN